jgi:hypothetical protein
LEKLEFWNCADSSRGATDKVKHRRDQAHLVSAGRGAVKLVEDFAMASLMTAPFLAAVVAAPANLSTL